MQRVRIGLTGLGFVFVLVLLATIVARQPSAEVPVTENSIAQQRAGGGAAPAEEQPKEPLAELGVAPGNAEHNNTAAAAAANGRPQP
jgi:hypothetical protein